MSAKHAAEDGSFGRSAGGAALRGAVLVAVAVLIGLVLLNANDDVAPLSVSSGSPGGQATDTTAVDDGTEGETGDVGDGSDDTTTTTAATAVRPPAEVRVLVANGTSVAGAAGSLSESLKGSGYNVLSATNTSEDQAASTVYFVPGFKVEAEGVAAAVGLPAEAVRAMPDPPPVDDTRGTNVLVAIGPDLAQAA